MTSDKVKAMIEFIEARLDDEERWANNATQGVWKLWGMNVFADPVGNSDMKDAIPVADVASSVPGQLRTWNSNLIAAHDPGRVRRQSLLYRHLLPLCYMETINFVDDVWDGEALALMMARTWADHYAFQKEWDD